MTPRPDPGDAMPRYQPLSRRRRLLLLGVAVATALLVIWLMLRPQLRLMESRRTPVAPAASAPLPCAAQQTQGCVGGTMGVIVAPAASR
jgi:hypothetical protein